MHNLYSIQDCLHSAGPEHEFSERALREKGDVTNPKLCLAWSLRYYASDELPAKISSQFEIVDGWRRVIFSVNVTYALR